MKYLAFIGSDGAQPAENVAVMNRDWPAYAEEMDRRGIRKLGRELELPGTAVTVRVRGGETLVTDGPFTETKEHLAGIDLLDCADLDEAIEVESKSPVAKFLPFEIRPLGDGLHLGPGIEAFGEGEDADGVPYLLIVWTDGEPAEPTDERALMLDYEAWRHGAESQGAFILGSALGGRHTATTLRPRDGEIEIMEGPFLDIADAVVAIDVIRPSDRQQALDFAATHPFARDHAIEVRAFYSEAAQG